MIADILRNTIGYRPKEMYREEGEYDPYKRTMAAIDIENAIMSAGPIPYSQFMDLSLAGPHGYYSTGVARISEESGFDFKTHPELHKSFAPTLALTASRVWQELGCPHDFPLVEMGAGRGTLALRMLDWIAQHNPNFYRHISYKIVDFPGMVDKQRKTLEAHRRKVEWYEGSALDLPQDVKGLEGMFLSNELPDAFPVEVVKAKGGNVLQKYITVDRGKFVEIWKPAEKEVKQHIRAFNVSVPDSEITINLNAVRFQHEVSSALRRGLILTIDYGEDNQVFQGTNGSVRTYSQNGKTLPATLAYERPGEVDITASIDFNPLIQVAQSYGGKAVLFKQSDYFRVNGLDQILSLLPNGANERALADNFYEFKVLTVRQNLDTMKFGGGLDHIFNLQIPERADVGMFRFVSSIPQPDDEQFLRSIKDSNFDDAFDRGNWESLSFPAGPQKYARHLEELRGTVIAQHSPFRVLYDFRKKRDVQRLLSDSRIGGVDIDAFLEGKPFL